MSIPAPAIFAILLLLGWPAAQLAAVVLSGRSLTKLAWEKINFDPNKPETETKKKRTKTTSLRHDAMGSVRAFSLQAVPLLSFLFKIFVFFGKAAAVSVVVFTFVHSFSMHGGWISVADLVSRYDSSSLFAVIVGAAAAVSLLSIIPNLFLEAYAAFRAMASVAMKHRKRHKKLRHRKH
jgi:hypothetical protein